MQRFIIIRVWGQLQLLWKINSCSEITGEVVKVFTHKLGKKIKICENISQT